MKIINKYLLITLSMALGLTLSACSGCSPHTWSGESSISSIESVTNLLTVTFDAKGGQFSDGSNKMEVQVEEGGLVSSQTVTRAKYEFLGWYEKGKSMQFDFERPITQDTLLVAKWEKEEAKITQCTIPLSTFNQSNKTIDVIEEDRNTASYPIAGYIEVSLGATYRVFDDNGEYNPSHLPLNKIRNVFTIEVTSKNGGVVNNYTLTITKQYDVTVTYYMLGEVVHTELVSAMDEYFISYDPYIPEGYVFYYWTLRDGSDERVQEPFALLEDTDLFAKMEEILVTCIIDANGDTFSNGESTKELRVGVTWDIDIEVPTLLGYRFLGFFYGDEQITDKDGKGIITWHFFDAASVTIVASWEQINYLDNLEFDYSEFNGFYGTWPEYIHYGEYFHIPPTGKEWHRFLGWYCGDVQLTDKTGQSLAPWSFAADIKYTITPRFEVPDFVVYYYLNDVLIHTQVQTVDDYHNNFDLWVYETDNPSFHGWSRLNDETNYRTHGGYYIVTTAWEIVFEDYYAYVYAWID